MKGIRRNVNRTGVLTALALWMIPRLRAADAAVRRRQRRRLSLARRLRRSALNDAACAHE